MKLTPFAEAIFSRTYTFYPGETWEECAYRVASAVANTPKQKEQFFEIIRDRVFIPGGRYLYSAGRPKFMNSNCYGFVVGDSREEWAQLLHDATLCLSTGGGLGVNYSALRPSGTPIRTLGGTASGPIALMQMVNEVARWVMAGGKRRSALWAGLSWLHHDIEAFIRIKDWSDDVKRMKAKNFEYPAPLDMTNISVIIDNEYLQKLRDGDVAVQSLHKQIIGYMARTGEPAFRNQSRILRDDSGAITGNACQESTLHPDDSCNLGSIVLPRIRDLSHLEEVTRLAVRFLFQGTEVGIYPTKAIAKVVQKNHRIGLGLMGIHEFLLMNRLRYGWSPLLKRYLKIWKETADDEKKEIALDFNVAPITTRAIAPTGTISIIAETTSGIEPIFCVAYKRRYINGGKHLYQYVVDPTAKRLLDSGIQAKELEDTYTLSLDIARRLEMQANVQDYVDQAISNTVNLPAWGTKGNDNLQDLIDVFTHYLPRLKGLTCYPNNGRSGQPLTPCSVEEALENTGVVFEEDFDRCSNGVCGL